MTTKHEQTTEERIAEIRAKQAEREPCVLYMSDSGDIAFLLAEVDRLRAAALPASVVEEMRKVPADWSPLGCIQEARSEAGKAEEDLYDNANMSATKAASRGVALLLRAIAALTTPGDGR